MQRWNAFPAGRGNAKENSGLRELGPTAPENVMVETVWFGELLDLLDLQSVLRRV